MVEIRAAHENTLVYVVIPVRLYAVLAQRGNDGALPEREGPLRDHPALAQDRESSIKAGDHLLDRCRPGRALISRAAAAKTRIAPSGAR